MTGVRSIEPQRFQFSLRALLLFTAGLGVELAILVSLKTPPQRVVFLVACASIPIWCLATVRSWPGRIGWLLVLLVGNGLFLPTISVIRGPARRNACSNHLHNIAIALQKYAARHGSLPPAYVADASGKPMHSWRVLLLPYLEGQDLYDAYNFNEPWNGSNNRKLWSKVPWYFQCPSDSPGTITTSYVAVVGPRTAWLGSNGVKLDEISDGLDKTVLLVEVSNSGINWLEPRDVPFGQIGGNSGPPTGVVPCSGHGDGFNVVFADTSIRYFSGSLPVDKLKAMLTRDGGEKVDPDQW